MNAYKTFKRWRVIRRYDATYKLLNGVVGHAGNECLCVLNSHERYIPSVALIGGYS